MPELPEVETIVRTLRPELLGNVIRSVRLFRADIVSPADLNLPEKLRGRRLADIRRRAKRIIFQLDNGARFFVHLGMSGSLSLALPAQPKPPHTHLILRFDDKELRFVDPRRFGGIFWLGTDQPEDDGLGPEPLEMTAGQLACRLAGTRRAIKTALLDQTLLAGLGNIYADESLFLAGIDPRSAAMSLSAAQIARLEIAIKQVLLQAIEHRGSTLRNYRDGHGNSGGFQKLHRVYHRAGQPCTICPGNIERIVLGGRSTHFCPRCQAAPRPNKKRRRRGAS